jgi:hypothetical protein
MRARIFGDCGFWPKYAHLHQHTDRSPTLALLAFCAIFSGFASASAMSRGFATRLSQRYLMLSSSTFAAIAFNLTPAACNTSRDPTGTLGRKNERHVALACASSRSVEQIRWLLRFPRSTVA